MTKPTLNNPSDQELNEAFAVHVAGWVRHYSPSAGRELFYPGNMPDAANVNRDFPVPPFTQSADLVLQWLEKMPYWTKTGTKTVSVGTYSDEDGPGSVDADADTFPRAAVIALLRAHGVGVVAAQG